MTSLDFPSPAAARIQIDTDFLLKQFSPLAQVKRKLRTWNELGEKVLCEFTGAPSTDAAYWAMAKELVHAVVASRDPKHGAIRKRLGNLDAPSTRALLSTLGLWLAGEMGISVSITGPLVAVMLYGVAEAGGDWEVLRD